MSALRTFKRKAINFLRKPLWTKFWFLPAWVLLGIAKTAIFTVSFRRLAPLLGVSTSIAPFVPLVNSAEEQRARQIARLVALTARYTPWDSNCFPQAVAARLLLGLYHIPYVLYFGLMKDPDSSELKAHAWVVTGRVAVTGGVSFNCFTVVGCFLSPCIAKSGGALSQYVK